MDWKRHVAFGKALFSKRSVESAEGLVQLWPGASEGAEQLSLLPSSRSILLEVFAPWCVTCQRIEPLLTALAEDLRDKGVLLAKLDGSVVQSEDDSSPSPCAELALALQYCRATGYPSLFLFQRREEGGELQVEHFDGNWDLLEVLRWVAAQAVDGAPAKVYLNTPTASLLEKALFVKAQLKAAGVPVGDDDDKDDDCDECSL
jgi:thiol-disulfide isomerase/thioredoxin